MGGIQRTFSDKFTRGLSPLTSCQETCELVFRGRYWFFFSETFLLFLVLTCPPGSSNACGMRRGTVAFKGPLGSSSIANGTLAVLEVSCARVTGLCMPGLLLTRRKPPTISDEEEP